MTLSLTVLSQETKENPPEGNLLIVGGALSKSNKAVYEKFIDLAGGKENAVIGIIPLASSIPAKSAMRFKNDLREYGVSAGNINIIPLAFKDDKSTDDIDESEWAKNADNVEVVRLIQRCTGIWFTGGDQYRITKTLINENGSWTSSLKAIWEKYYVGAVIGGTSAGAAVMSDIMIAGGSSFDALDKGFTDEYSSSEQQEYGPLFTSKGINFFKHGIIDQHFDKKARHARLVVALYENKEQYPVGFGIDENTAMWVNPQDGTMQVIGEGGVTILDVSDAKRKEIKRQYAYNNIIVNYLTFEDIYHFDTKEITLNVRKRKTTGREYFHIEKASRTGIFTTYSSFSSLISYKLIDNAEAKQVKTYLVGENQNGFEVLLRKTEKTQGFWTNEPDRSDHYSALHVLMDITPVKIQITKIE